MENISAKIRSEIERRQADGATLADLARAADMDHGQLYRFLAGERDLRLATAAKLCEVLKLELRRRR